MVDIVTAILIGFCFTASVGAFTFLYYKKSENETEIRIQEIKHGDILKENKKTDFTPMWTERRWYPTTADRVDNNDSVTKMENIVTSTSNKVCDLDPTTAFPKVEEAKNYKAEPNESIA